MAIRSSTPARQSGRCILIVDDNQDCAVSLNFLCRLWGFDARCCYDGATALQSAENFRPDVFLLDIAMPRMSGYDLAQKLRSLPPFQNALFIAMTGYADQAHRGRGADCRFDHYLAKPADLVELKNLLSVREHGQLDRVLLSVN